MIERAAGTVILMSLNEKAADSDKRYIIHGTMKVATKKIKVVSKEKNEMVLSGVRND